MKSTQCARQTSTDSSKSIFWSRLQEPVPVPVVLLIFLLFGTLAGIGFFMKSMMLQDLVASLQAEHAQSAELRALRMSNEWLKNRVTVLQEEKATLLDNAVADLTQKSKIIESILDSVGVDIEIQVSNENSGGPFTSLSGGPPDELILRTERYLDTILNVPLGAPVPGVLTSRFGKRIDPINGKPAYHRGVDIRGKMGSNIIATADGTVRIQNYDKVKGRYIELDHGNGFVTRYAHLKRSLVQAGDVVNRGKVIGLVGNSGRSTGPHVHYEIHYDGKIVNPTKFVRIAKYLNKGKLKK
jgi:murein DD-endopeptidase MepM/ murein hydrolase activator NlpD